MFKVGDRVRVKSLTGYDESRGLEVGLTGVISEEYDDYSEPGDIHWHIKFDDGRSYDAAFFDDQLELLKKGKRGRPRIKPTQVNFLLKYDLDEDPIEEFETMPQVKERIKELAKRSDLKRDSIVIYHIRKKQTATIETTIKIK